MEEDGPRVKHARGCQDNVQEEGNVETINSMLYHRGGENKRRHADQRIMVLCAVLLRWDIGIVLMLERADLQGDCVRSEIFTLWYEMKKMNVPYFLTMTRHSRAAPHVFYSVI